MKRLLLVCSAWLLLASCTSSSPSVNYYLLDSGVEASTIVGSIRANNQDKPLLLVGEVTLSEFLRQSSLLVQLEDHELHYAMNHVWAEPLVDAIPKLLLKDLRRSSEAFNFERGGTEWFGKEAYRLKIQIDKFHPNTEQQVVLSGRYWLSDTASGETLARDFSLTDSLTQDGYGHAVVKMRRLVAELAQSLLLSL